MQHSYEGSTIVKGGATPGGRGAGGGDMRRDVLRMTILIGLALALAAPAGAQGSVTGSVRGMVTDPDGAGLPGVTVTASSDRLITGQLVAVTDEGGNYRFPSLPPGSYVIEASLAGMRTARQDGVRVSLGQALAVDLAMTMGEMTGVPEKQ
jgi:hypothetical protein